MDKAKHYLLKAREYLSKFKKMEKKGGPPKLKITNKKTINLAVIGGISFLLFVGLTGAIRAITEFLSSFLLVYRGLFVLSHSRIKSLN